MLNKLLKRLGKNAKSTSPTRHKASSHQFPAHDISRAAIQVTETLQEAGFSAYLVGGCVRDLLLGGHPKDFDVATNATPEQVTKLFRRSRIIGRRFKIVHVRFGREIIEVTTFRGSHEEANKKNEAVQCEKGILLRDNVYGDIESDAKRRDFTVNALYYDPAKEEILDFTNGLKDLEARQLSIIGNPDERYKEDPVRMLRAIRFAVKLGFTLTESSEKPIHQHADYLSHIPAARLFEEVLKLLMSGYATAILHKLKDYKLLAYLLPAADACLDKGSEEGKKLIFSATANTDKRIRKNQRVTPAFLYAAMLWPSLNNEMQYLIKEQKLAPQDALQRASQGLVNQQLTHTAIPKRFLIPMREIWSLQLRLPRRQGRRAYQLMEHPRFRAAYDFALLREESGEQLDGLGSWWTTFQSANEEDRENMVKALGKPRYRRQRKRKPRSPES